MTLSSIADVLYIAGSIVPLYPLSENLRGPGSRVRQLLYGTPAYSSVYTRDARVS